MPTGAGWEPVKQRWSADSWRPSGTSSPRKSNSVFRFLVGCGSRASSTMTMRLDDSPTPDVGSGGRFQSSEVSWIDASSASPCPASLYRLRATSTPAAMSSSTWSAYLALAAMWMSGR